METAAPQQKLGSFVVVVFVVVVAVVVVVVVDSVIWTFSLAAHELENVFAVIIIPAVCCRWAGDLKTVFTICVTRLSSSPLFKVPGTSIDPLPPSLNFSSSDPEELLVVLGIYFGPDVIVNFQV